MFHSKQVLFQDFKNCSNFYVMKNHLGSLVNKENHNM